MKNTNNKVVIAGASGYIGKNLLNKLKGNAELVGLSRKKKIIQSLLHGVHVIYFLLLTLKLV